MQPLTEQQTQRVWSRVMNAQAVPAAQMNEQTGSGSAAADSLTPEKLLELIRDERADSALYAHLACRMKGKAQAMLREMARQEACHAKQFGAVYFLKTGKKACPGRPDAPCVTCINETLRQRYSEEHAAHEAYRRKRRKAPLYAAEDRRGGMRPRADDPVHPADLPVTLHTVQVHLSTVIFCGQRCSCQGKNTY